MTEITKNYSCYLRTILLIYFFIWKVCDFFVIYIFFAYLLSFFLLFFIFFYDESECEQEEENSPSLLYLHKKKEVKIFKHTSL